VLDERGAAGVSGSSENTFRAIEVGSSKTRSIEAT
jgi:hypothetical protein